MFVAFKIGRLQDARRARIPNEYATDEQRRSRPIFNATLWAGPILAFFRVARSDKIHGDIATSLAP
jgi:hypothetical protein